MDAYVSAKPVVIELIRAFRTRMRREPVLSQIGLASLAFVLLAGCGDSGGSESVNGPTDTGFVLGDDDVAQDVMADIASDSVDDADSDSSDDIAADFPVDTGPLTYFERYIQANAVPGRFPASPCDDIEAFEVCVGTAGCGWMRTIANGGTCREDPAFRCILSGECECHAHDFHGSDDHEDDLELFVPLSIVWSNLAPSTSVIEGGTDLYETELATEAIESESLENFTSRTDFSRRTLTVRAVEPDGSAGITDSSGLSLTVKLMPVWDDGSEQMNGVLFEGLGVRAELSADQLSLVVGGTTIPVAGEALTGGLMRHQCNQFALVVPEAGDATAYLGDQTTVIDGLDMAAVREALEGSDDQTVLRIGAANAKVWDLRVYTGDRQLSADEVAEIGRRCGGAGDYQIPDGYDDSNARYSWGMGGYNIVPNHAEQHFSSGVYVTLWIPEGEEFPAETEETRDNLARMVGFWDRWHEQMFFEMDMLPFIDLRDLEPAGSLNSYRHYEDPLCVVGDDTCGTAVNYNNPCRHMTDLFQAFNWLPEDFPGEATSADHRRIAQRGGWTRWDRHDPDRYGDWSRPVHEHAHTAHFTLMRAYQKEDHYIRGIAGESFAEVMASYVLTGVVAWMQTGVTYYPTIPLAFEGRWDPVLERHVFKSDQPYQSQNIDDQGLGARFYGLNVWWTFVAHYAAKPYLLGRLAGDTDDTPGTTLQRMRFYLAQEGLDLGELFGDFAGHLTTWDWPGIGQFNARADLEPFSGIEIWCTENSGPDCTIDGLKIQADVAADLGTGGEWVDSAEGLDPGGFAYSTVRIGSAPGGSAYAVSLEFEVPERLYADAEYEIALRRRCRDDERFFSSRIVVVDEGTGPDRANRPQYYRIPGRSVHDVVVRVPEGRDSTIYLLAVPTPPFELEDVPGFVEGYSLTWPYRYRITRLDSPGDLDVATPIVLEGEETLELTEYEGNGFTYDCFAR